MLAAVAVIALLAPVTSLEPPALDAPALANATNATQRRYLRTNRCGAGYNTYQRRSETGRYSPALEDPEDCFQGLQSTDNPSPRSQRTRPGAIGDKNRFEMPEVLAHVSFRHSALGSTHETPQHPPLAHPMRATSRRETSRGARVA